jgi:hypothetical protein
MHHESRGLRWTLVAMLWGVMCSACEPLTAPSFSEEETALATQKAALAVSSSYIELRRRLGTGASLGRTCGAGNEVTPTCVSSAASDFNHHWMAPYDGRFTFSTLGAGSDFDSVLQITRWSDSTPLGCNDDASGTTQSEVTLNLAAGEEVRITVDGKGSACGSFQLNISGVESTCGSCNLPPTPCHETNGYCSGTTCVYPLKPVGAACDDGSACTVGDTCGSSGSCQGTPLVCDTPPGQCFASVGTCSNGTCQYAPRPAGSACNDGNSCTSGDYCSGSGSCYSGDRICCPSGELPCNGSCCGAGSYCNGSYCQVCGGYAQNRIPECPVLAPLFR